MQLNEALSAEFFKREILPNILTDEDKELIKSFPDEIKAKASEIVLKFYRKNLREEFRKKGNLYRAIDKVVAELYKHIIDIFSYINDFEQLKKFLYPSVKELPLDENFRITFFNRKGDIDKLVLDKILGKEFDFTLFPLTGVLIFDEKSLLDTDFIEDWQKENILNEAKYIFSLSDYYSEPFLSSAFIFRHKNKDWYVVKYLFPENLYIPNHKSKNLLGKKWQDYFKEKREKWLGDFRLDIYGKKPSVFNIMKPEEEEFLKNLKKNPKAVLGTE